MTRAALSSALTLLSATWAGQLDIKNDGPRVPRCENTTCADFLTNGSCPPAILQKGRSIRLLVTDQGLDERLSVDRAKVVGGAVSEGAAATQSRRGTPNPAIVIYVSLAKHCMIRRLVSDSTVQPIKSLRESSTRRHQIVWLRRAFDNGSPR